MRIANKKRSSFSLGLFLLWVLLYAARGAAIAGAEPASSPAPNSTPHAAASADVTTESDPTSTIKTINLQTTYTGASYGPRSLRATQTIGRVSVFRIGKSLLRLSMRFQTINNVANGLGDTQFFYLFSHQTRAGLGFAGISAQFPTATDSILGTGKWLIGPAGAYIFSFKPGSEMAGLLLQTGFSIAGAADRPNQSALTFLPFGTWRLRHGWYLKLAEAPWLFDLQRGSSLVPLGVGFGRVAKFGTDGFLVAVSDEATVIHANVVNAPKNTMRLTFTVLFSNGRR